MVCRDAALQKSAAAAAEASEAAKTIARVARTRCFDRSLSGTLSGKQILERYLQKTMCCLSL